MYDLVIILLIQSTEDLPKVWYDIILDDTDDNLFHYALEKINSRLVAYVNIGHYTSSVVDDDDSVTATPFPFFWMKELLMIMGSVYIAMFLVLTSNFLSLNWKVMDHSHLIMHFGNLTSPIRISLDISTMRWLMLVLNTTLTILI